MSSRTSEGRQRVHSCQYHIHWRQQFQSPSVAIFRTYLAGVLLPWVPLRCSSLVQLSWEQLTPLLKASLAWRYVGLELALPNFLSSQGKDNLPRWTMVANVGRVGSPKWFPSEPEGTV
jgi:hypothetical protein